MRNTYKSCINKDKSLDIFNKNKKLENKTYKKNIISNFSINIDESIEEQNSNNTKSDVAKFQTKYEDIKINKKCAASGDDFMKRNNNNITYKNNN